MREQIEWLNYWIEDANNENKNRILLIGDSVARDYRKPLNRMLKSEQYVVDLLAMSFSVFDKLFIEEIKHFVKNIQYKYEYIFFNLGTHHGYSIICADNKKVQEQYYSRLKDTLNILKSKSENIVLISGTPENEQMSDSMNDEIEIRNQILKELSINDKYSYIDLYQVLKAKKFAMMDKFHYLDDGYEYIASLIKQSIGFEDKIICSNILNDIKSFLRILNEAAQVYIYGDGKRAKLIKEYLKSVNKEVNQFIVSEEYHRADNDNQILLEEVLRKSRDGDIIIVTPESTEIWERLSEKKLKYYTLSKRIYIFIEEFVTAYLGNGFTDAMPLDKGK